MEIAIAEHIFADLNAAKSGLKDRADLRQAPNEGEIFHSAQNQNESGFSRYKCFRFIVQQAHAFFKSHLSPSVMLAKACIPYF